MGVKRTITLNEKVSRLLLCLKEKISFRFHSGGIYSFPSPPLQEPDTNYFSVPCYSSVPQVPRLRYFSGFTLLLRI